MSTIIKSNADAINTFGNLKSLNADADAVYTQYAARVTADGGTVINPEATKAAIKQLINIGVYGSFNMFISAKFGIKRDAAGGVLKAYSIDGLDMVTRSFGGGQLPYLEEDQIKFLNNQDTNVGSILTTEKPVVVAPNGFVGFGWHVPMVERQIVALTRHENTVGQKWPWEVGMSRNAYDGNVTAWINGGDTLGKLEIDQIKKYPVVLNFDLQADNPENPKNYVYFLNGSKKLTSTKIEKLPRSLQNIALYIDVGGQQATEGLHQFGRPLISYVYSIRGYTEEQALALSSLYI